MGRRLFVLQGGGPTAVINATLASVVEAASGEFEQIIGLIHGFEGRPGRDVVDLAEFREGDRNRALALTPGSILGSSRRKVTDKDLSRVLARMDEYKADSVIGIGGNGTMTALGMLDDHARNIGRDVHICGAPKTVDNDLPGLHVCPGYGSAARFVALATRDFGFDSRAMSTFDDVTILETMGRDTGWIAAASTLLKENDDDPPHIVLVPERPVDEEVLLANVAAQHRGRGHVFLVVNEMLRDAGGDLIGQDFQRGPKDNLGRVMYSLSLGTGNYLADLIWRRLGLQSRCLRPGSLGRAMSAMVSEPDRVLARRVGKAAACLAVAREGSGKMVTIDGSGGIGTRGFAESSGTRALPPEFLGADSMGFSPSFAAYASPLIGDVDPVVKSIF